VLKIIATNIRESMGVLGRDVTPKLVLLLWDATTQSVVHALQVKIVDTSLNIERVVVNAVLFHVKE
tara:strand:+ start:24 stop:221 length:198 start_codon:yes stop_codon:yes gene_type:complete